MPIFEYCCQECGKTFEYLVLGTPDPRCPGCDSRKVCKLMSTCGFTSKGSGGETVRRAAGASSCGGCTASSCAGCGH